MVKQITDETFAAEVLEAGQPVLVDFYADWCGPCKMLSPIVEELSETYGDRLKFFKCNVDECPEAAQKYGIMSIPALIIFKDGQAAPPMIGVQPKAALEAELAKY